MRDTFLQDIPNLWRGDSLSSPSQQRLPSGDEQLDLALGGGWPSPSLIEFLTDKDGIGEAQLLIPMLRQLTGSQVNERRIALWINAPHALNAVALIQQGLDPAVQWVSDPLNPRQAAWTMELALRSSACAIVIAWLPKTTTAILRRLKLATSTGGTIGVLFRPSRAAGLPSPATIRAELHAHSPYLHVILLKVQGRRQSTVMIDVRSRLEPQSTSTVP
jgi:protein ImuA